MTVSCSKPDPLRLGLRGCCPRCGRHGLFRTRYRLHAACPGCGLPLEQEDGWGLGAIPLNYGLTCVFWILPIALLFINGILSLKLSLVLAGLGAVSIPFLTYRLSKAMWVGIYYRLLPHELERPTDAGKEKGIPNRASLSELEK